MKNRRTVTALATAATAAAVLAPASSASAIAVGERCGGLRAVRCAAVDVTTRDDMFARGRLSEHSEGWDYIAVQTFLDGYAYIDGRWQWVEVARSARKENGSDDADQALSAPTPSIRCVAGRSYRSRVNWNWNNTDRGTIYSTTVIC